jgi:hypothetical protein
MCCLVPKVIKIKESFQGRVLSLDRLERRFYIACVLDMRSRRLEGGLRSRLHLSIRILPFTFYILARVIGRLREERPHNFRSAYRQNLIVLIFLNFRKIDVACDLCGERQAGGNHFFNLYFWVFIFFFLDLLIEDERSPVAHPVLVRFRLLRELVLDFGVRLLNDQDAS